LFYATTNAGERTPPSAQARGSCPTCGGPVLAKCGQVNAWHWAHTADADCDPWAERLTDWHRAYQCVVPPQQCEVVIGQHRADIVAASRHVVELQHSTISVDDIRARENHYGARMVWLFDARTAYESGRLSIRRGKKSDDYVGFRWKQPRRSLLACRRLRLLDLGEGLVLKIGKISDMPPYGGWGEMFETVSIWRWLRDGVRPRRLRWTGHQHDDLVERIARTAEYLFGQTAGFLTERETERVMKAALFPGTSPDDDLRAAISACGSRLPKGLHAYELRGVWIDEEPPHFSVKCGCGSRHFYQLGPSHDLRDWNQWVDGQAWPLKIRVECERRSDGQRIPVRVPEPRAIFSPPGPGPSVSYRW